MYAQRDLHWNSVLLSILIHTLADKTGLRIISEILMLKLQSQCLSVQFSLVQYKLNFKQSA